MSEEEKEKKEQEKNDLTDLISLGVSTEISTTYGSAIKEHVVAYSGVDNETGKELVKGLKQVSKSKVSKNYQKSNLKQQAGFSAEIKSTAKQNAENIIKGKDKRKIRSDDLGSVNNQWYDHFEIDASGNIIRGSGSQMKFVGSTPKAAFDKLKTKAFEKYLEKDIPIEVPLDFYDGMQEEAQKQIESLKKQLSSPKVKQDKEQIAKLQAKLEKCQKIKRCIKKSNVSNKEAMLARTHPKLSTAMDIGKLANDAGKEAAKAAAVFGGSISLIRNTVDFVKNDIEFDEAVKNIAKDTACSAITAYGTGYAAATVKGLLSNSKSQLLRATAKTSLPTAVVTAGVDLSKIMYKYINGDITGVECFEQMGESGVGMVSSAMFAALGQMVIPIPVVGAAVGSMVGYAIASASYGTLLGALKEQKFAESQRKLIEQECAEHIKIIKEYQDELDYLISTYLASTADVIQCSFNKMEEAIAKGDVNGFISGTNSITEGLGKKPTHRSMDEFTAIMSSDETIKI